jgi:hypothetical protein
MKLSAAHIQRLIREYQQAFEAVHNKPAPTIAWENGWFRFFPNGIRFRRSRFEEMRDRLRAQSPALGKSE